MEQRKNMGQPDLSSHPPARVVVINDSVTQLAILSGLLHKAGIEALTCTGAAAALSAMSADGVPDLIVTDLYMPGIDGWRFCRLLRSPEYALFNTVPILVVSATFSGDEPSRITADLGANAFMAMPVEGEKFIALVHTLLSGEKPQRLLRVLILEDSKVISARLVKFFNSHGYQADSAFTCQEGLNLAGQTAYDAAVIDYHLPDGQGDDLLQSLQQKTPECVCIMMTADSQPELALKWMQLGAAAYLQKPFDPEYLIALCEHARRERALLRIQDLLETRTGELRKSEERLRQAMDATNDGVWEWDVTRGDSINSPAYFGMLGYPPTGLPDGIQSWTELIHPDDRESVLAANRECTTDKSDSLRVEFRMRARDGSWRWILSR